MYDFPQRRILASGGKNKIQFRLIFCNCYRILSFGCVEMNLGELLEMNKTIYSNTDAPFALTDNKLKVCWANAACLKRFPAFSLQDSIIELVNGYDLNRVMMILSEGRGFHVRKLPEPFNENTASLIPILNADCRLIGCQVFFRPVVPLSGAELEAHYESVIAAFSNEYRMPLSVIFSALGLMARHIDEIGDDILKSYVKLIAQNSYRVLRLSNNIAEVSRYRSGISKIKFKTGDLCEFVSNLCEATGILTRSIGIPLDCSVPDCKITTDFDPDKLSLVFYNLLSNSCKYSNTDNRITVKLEVQGEKAVITVSDKGKGIRGEVIDQIFEPYFSFTEEHELSGAGLGLALVKFVVTQHGGTIALQSHEGDGTTVAFSIPIRKNGESPDYIAQNSADYLADRFSTLYVQMSDVCGCPLP
jgi:signal transduction histidine kinase